MDKKTLLAALADEHDTTLDLLDEIDETLLSTAEIRPGWTAKDLIAHIVAWEAELVTALFRLSPKSPPRYYTLSPAETDKLNAQWLAEYKPRPYTNVLVDFVGVRKQLIRQVNDLSEQDLGPASRYNWLAKNETIVDYIRDFSLDHEIEHREEIEVWWQNYQDAT